MKDSQVSESAERIQVAVIEAIFVSCQSAILNVAHIAPNVDLPFVYRLLSVLLMSGIFTQFYM